MKQCAEQINAALSEEQTQQTSNQAENTTLTDKFEEDCAVFGAYGLFDTDFPSALGDTGGHYRHYPQPGYQQ